MGNRWFIRPSPLPDETLSSWLVRLAYARKIKLQNLYFELVGRGFNVSQRDIDLYPPPLLIEKLCK